MDNDVLDTEALKCNCILKFVGVLSYSIHCCAIFNQNWNNSNNLLGMVKSSSNIDSEPVLSSFSNILISSKPNIIRNTMRCSYNPAARNDCRTALMVRFSPAEIKRLFVAQSCLIRDFSHFRISTFENSTRILFHWPISAGCLVAKELVCWLFALRYWTTIPLFWVT